MNWRLLVPSGLAAGGGELGSRKLVFIRKVGSETDALFKHETHPKMAT